MPTLIALPNDPRPAIEVFIDYGKGKITDPLEVAHAALHMAGYGLSLVHDHPSPPLIQSSIIAPNTIHECALEVSRLCEQSQVVQSGADAAKAFDWTVLIPFVLKIIELFLKR